MTRDASKLCDHGLFVGVNYYYRLSRDRWLRSANDANALREYFSGARNGNGEHERWRLVVDADEVPPSRLRVMGELRALIREIPAGGAGIVYFSGHAQLGTHGLLLKCYDTTDEFPEDSALKLAELLHVLGSRGAEGPHFLLILDCCREGESRLPVDELPPNVCALYACSHGDVAVQDSHGGVLTQSILGFLNETSSTVRLSARALHSRARQWAFRRRPAAAGGFELVGCWLNELNVPVRRSTAASNRDVSTFPTAVLRYSPENEEAFRNTFLGLKIATLEWYGFPLSDVGEHGIFEDYFWSHGENTFICEVRMPGDGVHWNASDFLLHLADALVETPAILLFRWSGCLEMESITWIRNLVDGNWHQSGAGETRTLVWTERVGPGEYRGAASLTASSGGSEVAVRCDTPELDALPLSCLRTTVRDIYEAFRAIRSVEE